MARVKPILLLLIIGSIIFPWRLICISHPLGHSHQHHEPGHISACELHRKYTGSKEQHVLPPMHCDWMSNNVDDYQPVQKYQVKMTDQAIVIVAVALDIIQIPPSEKPFIGEPEPKCRSATIISSNTLRGPPLV